MQFKRTPKPTFTSTVTIPVAGEEPEKLLVTWHFKRKSEAAAWQDESKGRDDVDSLMLVMADWNETVPLSRESLNEYCEQFPGAALALFLGYTFALRGAERGN